MKTWIEKFKISAALDQPPAGESKAPASGTKAPAEFAEQMTALDRALRSGPPAPVPYPGLHESIMAAVRDCRAEVGPARAAGWRWGLAGALTCLLMLGGWGAWHRVASRLAPAPFRNAASVEEQVAALPAKVLSPLSQEWQALNLDLEKTAEFLLASVP